MEAFQHLNKTLPYIAVHPDDYSPDKNYPLVILLHGFGSHMGDLAGLAQAIDPVSYLFVCPNAPLEVPLGPGITGFSWMPPRGTGTTEDIRLAEELIATFFVEVMEQYHIESGLAILGGFSQGGGMAYRCGLTRPDMFKGLAALSSGIPDPDKLRMRLPLQRTQAIFSAHGIQDSVISVERAREAKAFLETEGYSLEYKEYTMGHEINQEVLDDLVRWIHQVLPPFR